MKTSSRTLSSLNAAALPAVVLPALVFAMSMNSATAADWKAVKNWLQPPPGMPTIGPAHGDVAVASNGDVYVSVSGVRGGVQVYNARGEYLRNVSNAPRDFHGFVIHQEKGGEFIYGARLAGESILKMQLDGRIILSIAGSTIPEELIRKRDGKPNLRLTAVDVAPDGRIFAVDGYATDLIHVFNARGKYLNSFGGRKKPYRFRTCHKIAVDTRFDPARLLCCDRENRRLVTLSLDGEILSEVKNLKRPAAVAVYDNLAAVAEIEGRVSVLDKQGNTTAVLGENQLRKQTATNQVKPAQWRTGILTAPHGLDVDNSGNLLVTEYNVYGRVVRYNRVAPRQK